MSLGLPGRVPVTRSYADSVKCLDLDVGRKSEGPGVEGVVIHRQSPGRDV